jgi:hypothetical protein
MPLYMLTLLVDKQLCPRPLNPVPHIPHLVVPLQLVGGDRGCLHITVVKVIKVGGVQGVADPAAIEGVI